MSKEREQGFRHFDLPVKHLNRHGHYVPPKARDEAEIARRRALASGVLLAEQQQRGTEVAAKIVEYLQGKDDSNFSSRLIAAAGINTAWHNHAQGAEDVMRRRLWLPVHAESPIPITRDSLLQDSQLGLEEAAVIASYLTKSIEARNSAVLSFKKKYGRKVGNTALVLASVSQANLIANAWDEVEQQYHTRHAALAALEASETLEEQIGANPTFAQLPDHDSPLSVYIRRHGTNVCVEALEYATAEALEAA